MISENDLKALLRSSLIVLEATVIAFPGLVDEMDSISVDGADLIEFLTRAIDKRPDLRDYLNKKHT